MQENEGVLRVSRAKTARTLGPTDPWLSLRLPQLTIATLKLVHLELSRTVILISAYSSAIACRVMCHCNVMIARAFVGPMGYFS